MHLKIDATPVDLERVPVVLLVDPQVVADREDLLPIPLNGREAGVHHSTTGSREQARSSGPWPEFGSSGGEWWRGCACLQAFLALAGVAACA
jgi:hypothetical protein